MFERRDMFAERSKIRNINRNQTKFKERINLGDIDNLCWMMVEYRNAP
jgi:hypothetical protein